MRYGKCISLLLSSLVLALVLVFALGTPALAQDTATPTPTPVIWPTTTATPTNTPGPVATNTMHPIPTSTPLTPPPTFTPTVGPPGGPGWNDVEWVHPPTSAYRPGCPAWSSSGIDTSRLDWRWLAGCLECVPGAFYDPLSTPLPGSFRTPTALPDGLYLGTDWDNVYVEPFYHSLLERDWNDQLWSFPALDFDVVGVRFTVATGYVDGSCELRLRGDRVGSPVVDDLVLRDGDYCIGPAAACAQYAPGARRPSDRFRVVNAGVAPVLSTRAGGAECVSGFWTLSDIQFLGVRYFSTPVPTATATPASPYALTCPMRLLSVAEGTSEYVDIFSWGDGARYPWGYPDHRVVYGVVFRVTVPHVDHVVFVSRGGGVSLLSGAVLSSPLVAGDLYCAAPYDVCRAVSEGEYFRWFDLPDPVSVDDVFEFGLRVLPVDQNAETRVDLQFIVSSPGPDCSVAVGPTPTPGTPTPTYVPASVRWSTAANAGCSGAVLCTRVSDYVLHMQWSAPAGTGVSVVPYPRFEAGSVASTVDVLYVPDSAEFPHGEWYSAGCVLSPSDYWWWGRTLSLSSFQRGPYDAEVVSVNGVASLRRKFKDLYDVPLVGVPYEARSCPSNSAPPRAFSWYVVIERVNGVETSWASAFAVPTPTPTPTLAPVVRTPTPGPGQIVSDQCEWVALRKAYDPPMVFPQLEHLTPHDPACVTFIPRFSVNLPDAIPMPNFDFPAFGLCFDLYRITALRFLGISLDPSLIVFPLFIGVFLRLFSL